ncbi:hypothetical protein [Ferruginibacter sp.]|nr:hypothetical protein [Ferruginibacter sp.]
MQIFVKRIVNKRLKNGMLRILILAVLLQFNAHVLNGQILITSQLPQGGISLKNQLWNITLSNAGTSADRIRISMLVTDRKKGIPVFSAETGLISLLPGIKLIQEKDVQPIIYTVLNHNYNIDASPNGFLPAGNFDVCYTVLRKNAGEAGASVAEDCSLVQVEPLNPPLLMIPEDLAVIDGQRPFFTWLPPAPMQMFNRLTYDFKLVEVRSRQSPEAALQQQLPLLYKTGVLTNNFAYPASAAHLDTGKNYAWQVIAVNNGVPLASSEIWTFRLKRPVEDMPQGDDGQPYYKLQQGENSGYFVCNGSLKIVYENRENETTASIRVFDITQKIKKEITTTPIIQPLKNGENFISYDLSDNTSPVHKHLYLIELINSKGELWTARFEYRKQ